MSSIGKISGQSSKLEPGVSCPVLAYQLSSSSSFISEGELFSPRTVTPPPAEPSDVFPFQFNTRIRLLIVNAINGVISSGTLEGLTKFLIDFGERYTYTSAFLFTQKTSGVQGHRDFFNTFFMGCTDFTTPEDFFDYLSHRFFEVEIDENIKRKERIDVQMRYSLALPILDGAF